MQMLDNLRVSNEVGAVSSTTGHSIGGSGSSLVTIPHSPSATSGVVSSQISVPAPTGSVYPTSALSYAANQMQSSKWSHPKNTPLNAEAFWSYMDTLTRSNGAAGIVSDN